MKARRETPRGAAVLFAWCNATRSRCYLANALTLGLYGAAYVVICGRRIGEAAGARLPGPFLSLLLTVISFGIFPGVMLPVLAFKRGGPRLGWAVMTLDIASLVSALCSGAVLLLLSVALWTQAVWLLAEADNGTLDSASAGA